MAETLLGARSNADVWERPAAGQGWRPFNHRHVLDLDAIPDYEAVVARCFDDHITAHNYGGDQIRFLRSVREVFLSKGRLSEADLYDAPLTNFGRNAVDRFFTPAEIKEIVALTDHLAA